MIISLSKAGLSFKGAHLYLMHDVKASTRERVDWTHTENMLTRNPDKAWKVMAYTAIEQNRLKEASGVSRAGRKTERPALAFSLSWHPEQDPDRDEMLAAAKRAIVAIGLSEHEALIVAHKDTPHKHVHVLVNRIHPITGRTATLAHSKRKLSALSHQLELEGGKIYCQQRKDNLEMQQEGISTRYRDPVIQNAWNKSETGEEFRSELAKRHYHLVHGRSSKRMIVVDAHGALINPVRHLENVKTREFREKMADIDSRTLPDADKLAKEVRENAQSQSRQDKHYSEESAQALNDMQTRHFDEYGELMNRHSRCVIREKEKLIAHYGFDDAGSAISQLEGKCEKPGWWRRITGLARRDRERLENLKKSLASGKTRYTERMSTMENAAARELEQLKGKQAEERSRLVELVAERRPLTQPPRLEALAEKRQKQNNPERRIRRSPRPRQ